MEEMDILKIMDEFIKDNKIQLLIELQEGTINASIKDNIGTSQFEGNTGLGAVIQMYILIQGFESAFEKMIKEIHADPSDKEAILDDLFRMIKGDMLKNDKL